MTDLTLITSINPKLSDKIAKCLKVMYDPNSYVAEETEAEGSEKAHDFTQDINTLISDKKENIDLDEIISLIVKILKHAIQEDGTDATIDITNGKEKLLELLQKQKEIQNCSRFDFKIPTDDDFVDDILPLTVFLDSLFCSTCGHAKEHHKSCLHFSTCDHDSDPIYDFNMCKNCGLLLCDHATCDMYCPDDNFDKCINCTKSRFVHRSKICTNPTKHSKHNMVCSNCFNNITEHFLTEKFNSMNKKSSRVLMDNLLFAQLTIVSNDNILERVASQKFMTEITNFVYSDITKIHQLMQE